MTTATLPTKRIPLFELVYATGAMKVDREQGIIHDVKILGMDSDNQRRYLATALEKAKPLYEGVHVNIDHPFDANGNPRPDRPRSSYDRFGKFVGVNLTPDGLRGDLHFLKSHPMAERVCEAAERMPDAFAMSHNADGTGHDEDGVFVVEEIPDVRHVDLVADGATTQSLFESRNMPVTKKTFRQVFEAAKSIKAKAKVKALLEEGEGYADAEMGDSPEAGDYKQHLLKAVASLLDSEDEGDLKKVDGIMKILKPAKAKETEEGDEGEEKGGEKPKPKEDAGNGAVEEGEECEKKEKEKMESRLRYYDRKEKAEAMLEAAGLPLRRVLVKAMARCENDAEMKELIEDEKARVPLGNRPRSQSPGSTPVQESRQQQQQTQAATIPTDPAELANFMFSN